MYLHYIGLCGIILSTFWGVNMIIKKMDDILMEINGIKNIEEIQLSELIPTNSDDYVTIIPCLYVRYKFSGSSTQTMEFFMVPNPTNQTYSIRKSVTSNGSWKIAMFDLSSNSNVYNLSQITGWRFDPVGSNSFTIDIDYIGVSDRCIY